MDSIPYNGEIDQNQKRKRDVYAAVITLTFTVFTTFVFSNAIWAAVGFAFMIYFLLDLIFTFLKKRRECQFSSIVRFFLKLVVTAVVLALAWNFYFLQQYHGQHAALLEGDLIPTKALLTGNPTVQVGNSETSFGFGTGPGGPRLLPSFVYRAGLHVNEGPAGVLLTTSVKDREGHLIAAVRDNHWRVYPPYCSDKNYTGNSLEVEDSSGEVVLQVVLIGSTAHIQGIWRDQFGAGEELSTDENEKSGNVIIWPNAAKEEQIEQLITPIFRYPSSRYWRQRIPKIIVDDFESAQDITLTNNSTMPLIALNVTATATDLPIPPLSYPLRLELSPNSTRTIKFPSYARSILKPTVGNFEDQWEDAKKTFKNCVTVAFFSGMNGDFGYIVRSSRAAHVKLAFGYAVGVIRYRARRSKTPMTTRFPLRTALILKDACLP